MSNRRSRLRPWALVVLGLALAAAPARGAERDAAVSSDGALYVVREGTYGELFPGQGLADPGNSALAIDVVSPTEGSRRLLVPGTETSDVEDSASIFFEDQSGTLFVLWQSRVTVIHSRLNLIGLRSEEWTAPIETSGNPFGWKSSPQLAVTRDTFHTQESDGSLRTWTRTVVHLVWWEDGPSGEVLVLYSPVTLLDGTYTGWNPVYRLDEFDLGAGIASPAAMNLPLAQAPRIEAGRNAQSVVAAFVLPGSGQLVTAALEVLPGEISFIADKVRNQIIEVGRQYPDQPKVVAGKVRNQIIEVGNRIGLHPSISAYAAQVAAEEIEASSTTKPSSLAEKVRNQIIEVGARITDRGLTRVKATQRLEILETSNGEVAGAPPNHLRVVEASNRPAPQTGKKENALFLSLSGGEVLASWVEDGAVYYRESRGQEWTDARPLRLDGEIDLARAREILARRADERSDE